jgi:catechol 2,3-dioxygenase-like lactoylglutathione lyase family enzyme
VLQKKNKCFMISLRWMKGTNQMTAFRYLVKDVDSSIDFYVKHLGFTLDERMGPAFAIVVRDGLKLWLSGPLASAARPLSDGR